jgi:hypothetical protein
MKKNIFLCLFSFWAIVSVAQTTQKGTVRELNSGKKPVAGVQIIFFKANPTDTDGEGKFQTAFSGKKDGDLIIYDKIYKKGYEIVNEKALQTAKLSTGNLLDIILCKAGVISQKKVEYYDISVKAITAGHERRIRQLKMQLADAKIAEEEFLKEQSKLTEEKANALKYANTLAEKFSITNF